MARFAKQSALLTVAVVLGSTAPAISAEAHYTCSGGGRLSADFTPPDANKGKVKLTFGTGRKQMLPQVLSADGGRYADADTEFWIKGRIATLTMKGVKESCVVQ